MPSLLLPMTTAADGLDDTAPVLTLYPAGVPLALSQFLKPNDYIQQWLAAALPLVLPSLGDETPVATLRCPASIRPRTDRQRVRRLRLLEGIAKAQTNRMAIAPAVALLENASHLGTPLQLVYR